MIPLRVMLDERLDHVADGGWHWWSCIADMPDGREAFGVVMASRGLEDTGFDDITDTFVDLKTFEEDAVENPS